MAIHFLQRARLTRMMSFAHRLPQSLPLGTRLSLAHIAMRREAEAAQRDMITMHRKMRR